MELAVSGLGKRYGERFVLDGVTIAVAEGSSLAVTGPSGCGKSTLLRLLAGREAPDAGSVRWDGADPRRWSRRERLERLACLDQHPHLEPALTTRENVLLRSAFATVPGAGHRADELLARMGLDDAAARPAGTLSGGQRVRAALARTLLGTPRCIIADEPTAALDRDSAATIAELLLGCCKAGIGLVIATHDRSLAERCHQRLALVP